MAQNKIRDGKRYDYSNGGEAAVLSGQLVLVGGLAGVALTDIAPGAVGALDLEGVYELPHKATGEITAGAAVYWDADGNPLDGDSGDGALTGTSGGNVYVGRAWATAAAAAESVQVLLNA